MSIPMPTVARVEVVIGRVGSGKTEHAASRVEEALRRGLRPDEVLALSASPQAAQEFERRLAAKGVDGLPVRTVRECALAVLAAPAARAFTGRQPRMLHAHDQAFLLEDERVVGTKEKRLKEMTRFFERMWSELADDDPSWLLEGEETCIHSHLKACLAFGEGLAEPEISNFAVRTARACEGVVAEHGARLVVIDDFGLLSRASQVFACMLAGEAVVATADPLMDACVFERYPYGAGVDELLAANSHAEVVRLEQRGFCVGAAAAERIACARVRAPLAESGIVEGASRRAFEPVVKAVSFALPDEGAPVEQGASAQTIEVCPFEFPEDEAEGIAALVGDALAKGVVPENVCIACCHRSVESRVAQALTQRDIPVATLERGSALRGDVRQEGGNAAARMLSLLALVADGRDALAWRSICGFGDPLARSYAFSLIRAYGEQRGLGLVDALDALSRAEGDPSDEVLQASGEVLQIRGRVKRLLNRLSSLTGHRLVEGIAKATLGEATASSVQSFEQMLGGVGDEDTAASLWGRVQARLAAPRFGEGVRVMGLSEAVGLNPGLLVVAGLMNGFVPKRAFFDRTAIVQSDAEALWASGLHALYPVIGSARNRMVLTYSTRMEPAEAQRVDVHVDRVRIEKGQRVCVVGPSSYLDVILGKR